MLKNIFFFGNEEEALASEKTENELKQGDEQMFGCKICCILRYLCISRISFIISLSQTAANSNTNTIEEWCEGLKKVLTHTFDHWLYYPIFIAFTSAHFFWKFSTHRVRFETWQTDSTNDFFPIFSFSMCLRLGVGKGCNNNKLVKTQSNSYCILNIFACFQLEMLVGIPFQLVYIRINIKIWKMSFYWAPKWGEATVNPRTEVFCVQLD